MVESFVVMANRIVERDYIRNADTSGLVVTGGDLSTKTEDVFTLMRVKEEDRTHFRDGMMLSDRVMQMRRTVTVEGKDIRQSLTHAGLKAVAEHYRRKYDLSIHLATIEEANDLIRSASNTSFGILVTSPDSTHVTPIYCHMTEEDKFQIYVMDSIRATLKVPTLITSLLDLDNVAYSDGERQASYIGCSVDALTLLKYTHLAMQRKDRLPPIYSETATTHSNFKSFKIPSSWAPSAQILSGVDTGYDDIPLNKHGETAQQIRKKHVRVGEIKVELKSLTSDKPYCVETVSSKPLRCYIIDKNEKYLRIVRKVLEEPIVTARAYREQKEASYLENERREARNNCIFQIFLIAMALLFTSQVGALLPPTNPGQ